MDITLSNGSNLSFGFVANFDFIQDATDKDPLAWLVEKASMFTKNDEGALDKWQYKGSRDLVEVALYSGINTYAIRNKTIGIDLAAAKAMVYTLEFDERNLVTSSLFNSVAVKGEKVAQEAVS